MLDKEEKMYMSVTDIVANFKEGFDPYKIQKNGKTLIDNYVEKYGKTHEEWLDIWARNGEQAALDGRLFHKFKEVGEGYLQKMGPKKQKAKSMSEAIDAQAGQRYTDLEDGIYKEFEVTHRGFMIKGRIDELEKKGNLLTIRDYKQTLNFEFTSYKDPKSKKYKMMQGTANALMDCHLGHFTLQLNIYGWILSKMGFEISKLEVEYYQMDEKDKERLRKGEDISYIQPEIINIPINLKLAENVIRSNNTAFRKSKDASMYLI